MGGQRHAPDHFTPGKDPVPNLQEDGWGPRFRQDVWGKSRPQTGIRPADRPARSQSLRSLPQLITLLARLLGGVTNPEKWQEFMLSSPRAVHSGTEANVTGGRFQAVNQPSREPKHAINPLTPNNPYRGRTAPLTSKVAFYIFIQQI